MAGGMEDQMRNRDEDARHANKIAVSAMAIYTPRAHLLLSLARPKPE